MVRLTNARGADKILPLTMSFRRVPLEIEVPTQPLFGRHGEVVVGRPRRRPRKFTLQGSIYHHDKNEIRRELDSILSLLMHPPIEVYRHHTHDRCLVAYPVGAPHEWRGRGQELNLQITMVAPDPDWVGPTTTASVSGTRTIEVAGTAPTHPLIKTTGSVSSLTVSNALTGKGFAVTGASGVVEVNCDHREMTVKVNGINRIDLINEDWLLNGWELVPGANQIATNTPIMVTYRPRWY